MAEPFKNLLDAGAVERLAGHVRRADAAFPACDFLADVAPGARAAATEAGLSFLPFGSEAFDLALPRNIWFRRLFQELLGRLQSGECRQIADLLGGYDFTESGELVWGED